MLNHIALEIQIEIPSESSSLQPADPKIWVIQGEKRDVWTLSLYKVGQWNKQMRVVRF